VRSSISAFALATALAAMGSLATVPEAAAVPFSITSTLTGDFRADNPDDIFVNVTITGDTTSNVAHWVVDLASPAHPNATLDVFAFNLFTAPGTSVVLTNFSPFAWNFTWGSGSNVPGSGGANFRLETNDPAGPSNNVTNATSLTFDSWLVGANWSLDNFLNAPLSTGGGIPDPGAQLGAHVRSLSTTGCTGCSDSGFATGTYGGPPTSSVPEPATLMLLGLGLLGAGASRRFSRRN
jgi:hypothetical protein